MKSFKRFLKEEDGVTALEYALLAAVVGAALIAIAGPAIRTFFTAVFDRLSEILGEVDSTPPT